MDFIFTSIAERIKTLLPEIKHIDLWNQQTTYLEQMQPFARPAVFIEWEIAWQSNSKGLQVGEGTLTIHLVNEVYAESHFTGYQTHASPDHGAALLRLTMLSALHAALHQFAPQNCSALSRTLTRPDYNHPNLTEDIMQYRFKCNDDSARLPVTEIMAGLRIEARIPTPPDEPPLVSVDPPQ